ncbi:MAG: hypothetical protein CMH26_05585 [Micavibrio sp.]|nr:hypothetical protein [Micavibrio sp.]|tara:strand:+ start:881 stop:1585 length:705 start_codon:yes stop_codon:yes gene_type:complete
MSLSKAHATAAAAVVATGLTFTPANDAEAALYHFDLQSEITYVDTGITSVNLGDNLQIRGVIETDGLYDAASDAGRVNIGVPQPNVIDVNVVINGEVFAVDSMGFFGRTEPSSFSDNGVQLFMADPVVLDNKIAHRILGFDAATISLEDAASVDASLDAIFNNWASIYGGAYNNPQFTATTTEFNSYFENEATSPTTNVSSPATLALLGLGVAGLIATRRREGIKTASAATPAI